MSHIDQSISTHMETVTREEQTSVAIDTIAGWRILKDFNFNLTDVVCQIHTKENLYDPIPLLNLIIPGVP